MTSPSTATRRAQGRGGARRQYGPFETEVKIHMKSIKVLAPLSQAALLLEMRSRENYPGRAERRLSARRRASLCETMPGTSHRAPPHPASHGRAVGGWGALIRSLGEQRCGGRARRPAARQCPNSPPVVALTQEGFLGEQGGPGRGVLETRRLRLSRGATRGSERRVPVCAHFLLKPENGDG